MPRKKPAPKPEADPAYVKTYVELAEIIGANRRSITRWSKLEGAPRPKSNGRHDVAAWRTFLKDKAGSESPELEDLKIRDLLAKCEERELKNAIRRGEFVRFEEVRTVWTSLISQAMQLLEKRLLDELPPILAGKDPIGIRNEIEAVTMEVRRLVHTGEGLTP